MSNLALRLFPERNVHVFCNQQALSILKNDGHEVLAKRIHPLLSILDEGNRCTDHGFRSVHHYYDPFSRKGFLGFAPADKCFASYFKSALVFAQRGQEEASFFYLGSAIHLIQDLCVPHHSQTRLLYGHREYENWVACHYSLFTVHDGGCYDYQDPLDILHHNALEASQYQEILHKPKTSVKMEGTRDLLGLAQRSSASLLHLFNRMVGLI